MYDEYYFMFLIIVTIFLNNLPFYQKVVLKCCNIKSQKAMKTPSGKDLGGKLPASEKWALGARHSALGWGKLLLALGSLEIFWALGAWRTAGVIFFFALDSLEIFGLLSC